MVSEHPHFDVASPCYSADLDSPAHAAMYLSRDEDVRHISRPGLFSVLVIKAIGISSTRLHFHLLFNTPIRLGLLYPSSHFIALLVGENLTFRPISLTYHFLNSFNTRHTSVKHSTTPHLSAAFPCPCTLSLTLLLRAEPSPASSLSKGHLALIRAHHSYIHDSRWQRRP